MRRTFSHTDDGVEFIGVFFGLAIGGGGMGQCMYILPRVCHARDVVYAVNKAADLFTSTAGSAGADYVLQGTNPVGGASRKVW